MSGEEPLESMTLSALPSSGGKNENGTLPQDTSILSAAGNTSYRRKNSQLKMGKKIYEFYNAPVTKFWLHTVGEEKEKGGGREYYHKNSLYLHMIE